MYTSMLNTHGGIESDLTAVRMVADAYRLYVGTASLSGIGLGLSEAFATVNQSNLSTVQKTFASLALWALTAQVSQLIWVPHH